MLFFAALALCDMVSSAKQPPNIVFMVIDDVGWADVSYHGGNFSTPNIDRLATKEGVRLENYYVQEVCTPTRSALMTGRYPFRTGMQGYATFAPGSTAAIPKDTSTIAEVVKEAGYATYAIGKWHLGYASWHDTPLGRGFDSYAGYLQGAGDYYNHTFGASFLKPILNHSEPAKLDGYDFWRNKTVAWDCHGDYSMDLYMSEAQRILDSRDPSKPFFLYFAHQLIHQPLQKPPKQMAACDSITADLPSGGDRNTLCQMMVELDNQIGIFVDMLKKDDLWENTVLWVTTDNGGMTIGLKEQHKGVAGAVYSVSSNYPLRGGKATLFEGGVRGVSFVTGGFLPSSAYSGTRKGLLQHVDIPQTLAKLAGTSMPGSDGYDVWNYIVSGGSSPRNEVPVNIDVCVGYGLGGPPCQRGKANNALIAGKWKLVSGLPGTIDGKSPAYDGWWSNDPYIWREPNATQGPITIDGVDAWLFDLSKDECENDNVAMVNKDIVTKLRARMAELADPQNGYRDPQHNFPHIRSLPVFHNGTWSPYLRDENDDESTVVI